MSGVGGIVGIIIVVIMSTAAVVMAMMSIVRSDKVRLFERRMDTTRLCCGILSERWPIVGRPSDGLNDIRTKGGMNMTKQQADRILRFTEKVNSQIPRNGGGNMDDRAFDKFARRLCAQNKEVLKRLAEDR